MTDHPNIATTPQTYGRGLRLGHSKHSSESISESSQAEEAEEPDEEQTCWRATEDVDEQEQHDLVNVNLLLLMRTCSAIASAMVAIPQHFLPSQGAAFTLNAVLVTSV